MAPATNLTWPPSPQPPRTPPTPPRRARGCRVEADTHPGEAEQRPASPVAVGLGVCLCPSVLWATSDSPFVNQKTDVFAAVLETYKLS